MKRSSKFKVQGAELEEKIKRIKLLLLDVDGVLTDGKIVYDGNGNEIKAFDVKDGHGIKLLLRSGVKVGIITSRESAVVAKRAEELGIAIVYQGAREKLFAFKEILSKVGLKEDDTAFIGDDLIDIPILRKVGFSAAVSDAVDEVKEVVDYVTTKRGGRGAVREVCELLLKVKGDWDKVTQRYFL